MKLCAGSMTAAALATVLSIGVVDSAAPEKCHARLSVKFTPDVPNPRDPAFLSALAASPLYQIVWVYGDNSAAVVDLTGPATDYHCEDEIERLKRDAHILDLEVLKSATENARSS